MRAVVFSSYGPPDVLQVIDVDDPQAGAGQVRVRVKAAGVQPFDARFRGGLFGQYVPVHFPQTLGTEFAGVVDQVGAGVTGFFVGSEALGYVWQAAYAEHVVVGVDQIVVKPPAMPWEEAGVLSASGQTAHTALQELGVGTGDTVLIHAAAGGVGTFAVQLARAWGATVIGTASERNQDYLRSFGAVPTTYGDGLVDRVRALAPDGIDAALDIAGSGVIPELIELTGEPSKVLSIADFTAPEHGAQVSVTSVDKAGALAEAARLFTEAAFRIPVEKTFPLAAAADAQAASAAGHTVGKLVVTVP